MSIWYIRDTATGFNGTELQAAYCVPQQSVWTGALNRLLSTNSGDEGTTVASMTIGTQSLRVIFLLGTPGHTDWQAGTWTITIPITTTSMNVNATQVAICRLNSSNANVGTIAAETISINGNTSPLTIEVSGAAQPSATATDKFLIIVSASASMSSSWVLTPVGATIDAPIDGSAPPTGGTLKRWTGSVFVPGGTLKRWTGSVFATGGTLRRWTGSGWEPPP